MKYYLIAGEASGDLHGANLMKALVQYDQNAVFRFWGGDMMQLVGGTMVEHYRNMAFMGFVEVFKNLTTILGFIKKCKNDLIIFQPDVLVLIDYPGFNLRIAKWAKNKGIKVVYYITPQVWAWHKSRVHDLGRHTDLLLTILPFEQSFFKNYGYEARFVGHPLLDAIRNFRQDPDVIPFASPEYKYIALLPGSRKQEITTMLPTMIKALDGSDYQIIVACAPSIDINFYYHLLNDLKQRDNIHFIENKAYDVLSIAHIALVGSGTATLETALFNVPQVVCYKGNKISYLIAKKLVDLKFISLVNLICDKEVVTELIQDNFTIEKIKMNIALLETNRSKILENYQDLRRKLGDVGASDRAAKCIIQMLHPI